MVQARRLPTIYKSPEKLKRELQEGLQAFVSCWRVTALSSLNCHCSKMTMTKYLLCIITRMTSITFAFFDY
jgi:hypothetical protein